MKRETEPLILRELPPIEQYWSNQNELTPPNRKLARCYSPPRQAEHKMVTLKNACKIAWAHQLGSLRTQVGNAVRVTNQGSGRRVKEVRQLVSVITGSMPQIESAGVWAYAPIERATTSIIRELGSFRDDAGNLLYSLDRLLDLWAEEIYHDSSGYNNGRDLIESVVNTLDRLVYSTRNHVKSCRCNAAIYGADLSMMLSGWHREDPVCVITDRNISGRYPGGRFGPEGTLAAGTLSGAVSTLLGIYDQEGTTFTLVPDEKGILDLHIHIPKDPRVRVLHVTFVDIMVARRVFGGLSDKYRIPLLRDITPGDLLLLDASEAGRNELIRRGAHRVVDLASFYKTREVLQDMLPERTYPESFWEVFNSLCEDWPGGLSELIRACDRFA